MKKRVTAKEIKSRKTNIFGIKDLYQLTKSLCNISNANRRESIYRIGGREKTDGKGYTINPYFL